MSTSPIHTKEESSDVHESEVYFSVLSEVSGACHGHTNLRAPRERSVHGFPLATTTPMIMAMINATALRLFLRSPLSATTTSFI